MQRFLWQRFSGMNVCILVVATLHNITDKCGLLVLNEWMIICVAKDSFVQRGRNEL
jgi:hypothetical protein